MNAPKTDFQCALKKVSASLTEKKVSPRSCSIVILEAMVLAAKKYPREAGPAYPHCDFSYLCEFGVTEGKSG